MFSRSRTVGKVTFLLSLVALVFASSAMAEGGVFRNVNTGVIMPSGTELVSKGWAKFQSTSSAMFECKVTAVLVAKSGSTGTMTEFTVPDKTSCVGTGSYAGCALTEATDVNAPYSYSVVSTEKIVVSGLEMHLAFSNCPAKSIAIAQLTLTPLAEGSRSVWGTEGHLGGPARAGEPVAGFSFTGEEKVTQPPFFWTGIFSGESELTAGKRSAWKIVAS